MAELLSAEHLKRLDVLGRQGHSDWRCMPASLLLLGVAQVEHAFDSHLQRQLVKEPTDRLVLDSLKLLYRVPIVLQHFLESPLFVHQTEHQLEVLAYSSFP